MAVLNALRRTPGALLENPVLFAPVLVLMLFQVPQLALQSVDPLLSSVVSLGLSLVFVVAMPFFQGGMIGMADEALDGPTSLRTFVDEGTDNYVPILVAYLALMAVNFVLGMVSFFGALAGGAVFFSSEGGSVGLAALAVVGLVIAVVALAYLLILFFVQFYGQAIVLEDLTVVDGFERSLSVVRHHLVSTLGYTVLTAVIGGGAGLVFGVASVLLSPRSTTTLLELPEPSLPVVLVAGLVVVAGGTLFGGFFAVFSVSFYRTIAG